MEKIESFKVNHHNLLPGIYISRTDKVADQVLITYDIRVTQPNAQLVLNTAEIHTIEHLAATFLRNHLSFKERVIYFGPMGCRTGFYLILKGEDDYLVIRNLIIEMFEFISNFGDEIPGATAHDCGNYLDHNLPMAKNVSKEYRNYLNDQTENTFKYHV
jgi:S-ribosylhomocysteine lyase